VMLQRWGSFGCASIVLLGEGMLLRGGTAETEVGMRVLGGGGIWLGVRVLLRMLRVMNGWVGGRAKVLLLTGRSGLRPGLVRRAGLGPVKLLAEELSAPTAGARVTVLSWVGGTREGREAVVREGN
jgi:hypothetical protein